MIHVDPAQLMHVASQLYTYCCQHPDARGFLVVTQERHDELLADARERDALAARVAALREALQDALAWHESRGNLPGEWPRVDRWRAALAADDRAGGDAT